MQLPAVMRTPCFLAIRNHRFTLCQGLEPDGAVFTRVERQELTMQAELSVNAAVRGTLDFRCLLLRAVFTLL